MQFVAGDGRAFGDVAQRNFDVELRQRLLHQARVGHQFFFGLGRLDGRVRVLEKIHRGQLVIADERGGGDGNWLGLPRQQLGFGRDDSGSGDFDAVIHFNLRHVVRFFGKDSFLAQNILAACGGNFTGRNNLLADLQSWSFFQFGSPGGARRPRARRVSCSAVEVREAFLLRGGGVRLAVLAVFEDGDVGSTASRSATSSGAPAPQSREARSRPATSRRRSASMRSLARSIAASSVRTSLSAANAAALALLELLLGGVRLETRRLELRLARGEARLRARRPRA